VSQSNSNVGGHGAKLGSWLACLVMLIGTIVGGIALVYWNWPIFWVGVGVFVLGVIFARVVNIMDDVTEYGGGGAGHDPSSASY
jgi:fatty acid desaturase